MTDQPEYTLDGKPLSACATSELVRIYELGDAGWQAAIRAELETRKSWPPYAGLCVA